MAQRIFTLLLFLFLFPLANISGQKHKLYEIEDRLINGEKRALFNLAPYFDSDKIVVEWLGHHHLEVTESSIARRMVSENCLFLESEFNLTDSTTSKEFESFLKANEEKIVFSELADLFLITPFEDRTTRFEVVALTPTRKAELLARKEKLMSLDWVRENDIHRLVRQKDPYALLKIASLLVRGRYRYNRNYLNDSEFIDLLQLLTQTVITVPNETGAFSFHIHKDFYPESAFNLLIFMANHYSGYEWDKEVSAFVHPKIKIAPTTRERSLFELLGSENDTVAINAFLELTTADPEIVIQLATEYEEANINKNNKIPMFPYSFLKQLVVLTDYCKDRDIDFTGNAQLRSWIASLNTRLDYGKRYQLENTILSELTLQEITAFEYWSIFYGGGYESWLNHSAGRILDIFYSEHWEEVIADSTQLKLYLKKTALYSRLGIIGSCNNFHLKFINASPSTLQHLSKIQTEDKDIREQIHRIFDLNKAPIQRPENTKKEWDGNKDYVVTDLEEKLSEILANVQDSAHTENTLVDLLAQINYDQIGIALKAIEPFPFEYPWRKYAFMDDDWGFLTWSFRNDSVLKDFLYHYSALSEYDLYAHYLDQAGIDYKHEDNTLDYDKIYERLKYDIAEGFVGGGGGKRTEQVYSLIKLLELTFQTRLGYPKKLCNSFGFMGCDAKDRAWDWRVFLKKNGKLKEKHDGPVSFNFEYE